MTQKEFTDRTNLNPTPEESDAIHALYMATNLDKDEFCEAYRKVYKLHYSSALLKDVGAELHNLTKEINKLKRERKEMTIFIAEQAEVSSNCNLRAKAIEMMGEKEYIFWKIENDHGFWQLDLELIKKLVNQ